MLKSMRKNGLILAMFALGCSALVVVTHELTKDKIAHQQQLQKQQTLSVLLPEGSYDNDLVASCKQVISKVYLGSDQPQALYTARKNGVVTAMRWRRSRRMVTAGRSASWRVSMSKAPSPQCECLLTTRPPALVTKSN